jgi:8-oxo-dGTP diphosphatase
MAKDICCKISGKLFALNVDAIITKDTQILLTKRDKEPFKGLWALPGGRVKMNEMLTTATLREVKEEAGIKIDIIDMFSEYSDLDRDPRGRFVSIVFICTPKSELPKKRTKEASDIKYFSFNKLPKKMAFDHKNIRKCQDLHIE